MAGGRTATTGTGLPSSVSPLKDPNADIQDQRALATKTWLEGHTVVASISAKQPDRTPIAQRVKPVEWMLRETVCRGGQEDLLLTDWKLDAVLRSAHCLLAMALAGFVDVRLEVAFVTRRESFSSI
jgi:hypothetical protein